MPERHLLDYFSLIILFFGLTMVVMAFMWLHEYPTRIAAEHNHGKAKKVIGVTNAAEFIQVENAFAAALDTKLALEMPRVGSAMK